MQEKEEKGLKYFIGWKAGKFCHVSDYFSDDSKTVAKHIEGLRFVESCISCYSLLDGVEVVEYEGFIFYSLTDKEESYVALSSDPEILRENAGNRIPSKYLEEGFERCLRECEFLRLVDSAEIELKAIY